MNEKFLDKVCFFPYSYVMKIANDAEEEEYAPLTDREDVPLAERAFQIQRAESGFGIGEPNRSV